MHNALSTLRQPRVLTSLLVLVGVAIICFTASSFTSGTIKSILTYASWLALASALLVMFYNPYKQYMLDRRRSKLSI